VAVSVCGFDEQQLIVAQDKIFSRDAF